MVKNLAAVWFFTANGKKIKEKDIVLLLPESKYVTLGRTAIGDWPYSGFLHSLKVYAGVIQEEEVLQHYQMSKPGKKQQLKSN